MNLCKHIHSPRLRASGIVLFVFVGLAMMLAGASVQPVGAAQPIGSEKDTHTFGPTRHAPDVSCVPDWGLTASPDYSSGHNLLSGVVALSTTDAWAVGTYQGSPYEPIIEHWNGLNWSIAHTLDPDRASTLRAITAVSANDIWAVGYYDTGNYRWHTLTLHWNGVTWTEVATPDTGSGSSYLFGATAISSTDVWAVGSYCCANYQTQTLVLHWNGSVWQMVASPSVAPLSNALYAVSAVSTGDVWAVGAYGAYDDRQTLIEHWDGNTWNTSGSSMPGVLLGVKAISSGKVWAVGYRGGVFARQTLILRLIGAGWEVAPSPNPGNIDNILYEIASISDDDIWAVGSFANIFGSGSTGGSISNGGGGYGVDETLIVHWDGGRWTKVPSPNRAYESNYLYALAVVSPGQIWAVGESKDSYYEYGQTLIARYVGKPAFDDVAEGDYFAEAVRYLYCAHVISGYTDNTFRPYNETTRSQLSKIVVLGEGWPIDTAGGPHFSDVARTDPFYDYVETAYHRGIVSGYRDGTFHPENKITRAQLCKVVVLARGWPIDTSGGPHFSDVARTDPFFTFIETSYNRRIIAGYEDRTFQPGRSATRGQISKIVYEAIISP